MYCIHYRPVLHVTGHTTASKDRVQHPEFSHAERLDSRPSAREPTPHAEAPHYTEVLLVDKMGAAQRSGPAKTRRIQLVAKLRSVRW